MKKDKVYIDSIIFQIQNRGGISSYWKNIHPNINSSHKSLSQIGFIKKTIKLLLPIKIKEINGYELFHSSYYRVPEKKFKGKVVTTIHDFMPELYSSFFHKAFISFIKKRAIYRSDAIICVSQTTKNDLIRRYPKIQQEKIHVIYNGISDSFRKMQNIKRNAHELLYVGNRKAKYKNFKNLVHRVSETKKYHLKIVGHKLNKHELKLLNKYLPNRFKLVYLPNDQELIEIYNSCHALVYPSKYEGFGLPVLEAMICGTPTIINNIEVFSELFKHHSLVINFDKKNELKQSLDELKKNYKEFQSNGVKFANSFSWEETSTKTYNLYKNLLSEK